MSISPSPPLPPSSCFLPSSYQPPPSPQPPLLRWSEGVIEEGSQTGETGRVQHRCSVTRPHGHLQGSARTHTHIKVKITLVIRTLLGQKFCYKRAHTHQTDKTHKRREAPPAHSPPPSEPPPSGTHMLRGPAESERRPGRVEILMKGVVYLEKTYH